MPFPKISIVFCVKCKWNLRSAWYLQELLQTFGSELKEVSMVIGNPGDFKVLGYRDEGSEPILIWDRVENGGFPDSKYLKQRVKRLLFNDSVTVGAHIDSKNSQGSEALVSGPSRENNASACAPGDSLSSVCTDCQ